MPVSLLFHNIGSNLAQTLPQDHTDFDFICWFPIKYIREFNLHGCTNCSNLEMEPKYLMKSDVKLNPNILRTKNDKRVYTVKSTK